MTSILQSPHLRSNVGHKQLAWTSLNTILYCVGLSKREVEKHFCYKKFCSQSRHLISHLLGLITVKFIHSPHSWTRFSEKKERCNFISFNVLRNCTTDLCPYIRNSYEYELTSQRKIETLVFQLMFRGTGLWDWFHCWFLLKNFIPQYLIIQTKRLSENCLPLLLSRLQIAKTTEVVCVKETLKSKQLVWEFCLTWHFLRLVEFFFMRNRQALTV